MGNVISNLKAKFGVDTSDFKKGLKDGEKATEDFKGAAGGIIEEFASMFGVNMSAVTDALGTANKSLSFLGQSFKGAAKGGDILAISMKFLKFAFIATGIGAIVVVLGSLIAYFTKSGQGADQFARILAQVKSVVNNVIDRLAVFGKGVYEIMTGKFKQGWKDMTGAFKGMGDEIKEDWKAAGQLADAEDALEDREIALITTLSARKAKAAELRQQAKEEIDDQKKKLSLLNEAEKLIKSVYTDEISLEKERLRIMKEKLAVQSSDPTDEERKTIAEQEAKVNDLLRERADELRSLLKEKNKVIAANEKEFAQFNSFKNLKMPDLLAPYQKSMEAMQKTADELHHTLIKVGEDTSALFQVMGKVGVDVSSALNDALKDLAVGTGEFLGQLMLGDKSLGDFGDVIKKAFGDLLITIGTAMIVAGMAKIKFDSLMLLFGGGLGMVAAGIGAIAFGTVLKGSLKGAAGGGSSSSSGSGTGSAVYDSRTGTEKAQNIQLSGKFTVEGSDLVLVLNQENIRRKIINGR